MSSDIFAYKIPEEILAKIPDDFWKMFYDELTAVFGDVTVEALLWLSGTFGWHGALTKTCKRLNITEVSKYYNGLEWYDSDLFDSELCDLLEEKLFSR